MLKSALSFFTFMTLSLLLPAQDGPKAAAHLKKEHPNVQWNVSSATPVDLDCDGKKDMFYWGIDPHVEQTFLIGGKTEKYVYPQVVLGYAFASGAKTQTLNIPFFKDTGYYGFRDLPTSIEVQPLSCDWEGGTLPACQRNRQCESLWIRDGNGLEAYIFWDSIRKAATWVRHERNFH
jgi:hypothetical protein